MAYDFFLSYTRANNDAFLKKFFEDLSQGIRDIKGLPKKTEVGFFDQQDIELGEHWDDTIVQALQTAKVFLAVASPAYFKSEYCGKEWAIFRDRLRTAAGVAPVPPLLKSVVWIAIKDLIAGLPIAVTEVQLTFGDPEAVHNEKGFKHLLKNLQDNNKVYNDLIDKLSAEIVNAAKQYDAVPPLSNVPKLRDVVPAFTISARPGVAAVPVVAPTGPKHVRLVYVAANPQNFGAARNPEPYMENGGADWKPFFPDDPRRVHRLVQNYVSNDELDFTSEELPFGANLLAQVEDAWAKRQIVVLIVDGWTLNWDAGTRAVLQQLDTRLDYHWCIFVPYNEHDGSVSDRAAIDAAISQTFDRHVNLAPNPLFFRDNIRSADDLKKNLQDVLTKLKEEIKKRAPVNMPIPAGPARAVITGPSSQG